MWRLEEKNRNGNISTFLSYNEYSCNCSYADCNFVIVYNPTIVAFESTRRDFGSPISISSGHRCQRHNMDSDGVFDSRHMRGQALDMVAKDLDALEKSARKYFDVVIRYETFVHGHKE